MLHVKLTAEQRLQKAAIDIMANRRYMALGGILLIGDRKVVEANHPRIQTAATDGKNEFYNRAFVDSMRDAELRFLVLHEIYHKLYRHLTTWRWMYDEDARLANQACDYVINVQLVDDNKQDKFATMTGPLTIGCYDDKYRGWDSARVFRDLQQQGKGGKGNGNGQPGNGQGQPTQGDGEGFDDHMWDEAKTMTAEEQQDLAREIDEAVRQGAMAAGKLGTGGERSFSELLQPQQDWREALREFVQATCAGSDYSSWRRPNRRYISASMYMPSGISEQIGEIVIAPDMSGSIGAREIQRMLSEVKGIAETVHPEAVRLLYWDTKICADERYVGPEIDNLVNTTKPAGGGGTMIECVPDHMRAERINAQCAVVFTDGYLGGGWGDWSCPVLWVIVDNKRCNPPFGTTVHVSSGQF
jgi:predicted metal-dependent peptidase